MIEQPTRKDGLLDLLLVNKGELVGNVKLRGSLGRSDRELVEFRLLRGGTRAKSRTTTLHFRRADF